jgi:hypothetical protein
MCGRAPSSLGLTLAVVLFAPGLRAVADEPAYCVKVRARATADAALLIAPRVQAEGIRFPYAISPIDVGPGTDSRFQLRFGLSFSPLDAWRGVRVQSAAEADCELHKVSERLRERVLEAPRERALPALKAQLTYLEAHRAEWQKLLSRAGERLKAGVLTALELQEVRRLVGLLERKRELVRGEAARVALHAPREPGPSLSELSRQYVDRSVQLEREAAGIRAFDAWGVKLRGGIIPLPGQPIDWFGLVEVSYSLGAFWHGSNEARYLEARGAELREARYELPQRAAELRELTRAEAEQARLELEAVESDLSSITATEALLRDSDAPNAHQARALLSLERYLVEADQIFLRTLTEALGQVLASAESPEPSY